MDVTLSIHHCGGHAVKTTFSLSKQPLSCVPRAAEQTGVCEKEHDNTHVFCAKDCCRNSHWRLAVPDDYLPHVAFAGSFHAPSFEDSARPLAVSPICFREGRARQRLGPIDDASPPQRAARYLLHRSLLI